jgi:hypothetical protein
LSIELIEIFNISVIILTGVRKNFLITPKDVTLILSFLKSLAFFVMASHLTGFHIFLSFRKMTTLDFIMRNRSNQVSPRDQAIDTNFKQGDDLNETSKL